MLNAYNMIVSKKIWPNIFVLRWRCLILFSGFFFSNFPIFVNYPKKSRGEGIVPRLIGKISYLVLLLTDCKLIDQNRDSLKEINQVNKKDKATSLLPVSNPINRDASIEKATETSFISTQIVQTRQ